MFELSGVTITGGMVVLAIAIGSIAAWIVRRRPYAVAALGVLIGAVHAVAYGTEYLDTATVASARGTAVDAAIGAFVTVAGALDDVFAATRWAIDRTLDALAATSMPETSVSVLEFGTFLLGMVVISALVCGALARIARWTDGTPIGEWLAALGVVFGAAGVVWTWLPIPVGELTPLHALLVVGALGAGVAAAAVAIRVRMPTLRRRVRAHR